MFLNDPNAVSNIFLFHVRNANLMPDYIPKYIIKRVFTENCIKKVPGGVEITMLNVLSPITAKALPDDVSEFLKVKVDGKPVPDDVIQSLVVTVNGIKYTTKNLKDLNRQTLPVGGTLTFFVPFEGIKSGEEHEFDLDVKSTNFRFKMSRVVQ